MQVRLIKFIGPNARIPSLSVLSRLYLVALMRLRLTNPAGSGATLERYVRKSGDRRISATKEREAATSRLAGERPALLGCFGYNIIIEFPLI